MYVLLNGGFSCSVESKEFDELFLEIVFGDDDQCREDHNFLLEMGHRIAGRLKGSPLAAKTVGRLLKTHLDLVHWTRVLESKEWEKSNGKNDIMPALKLSFDYLPSQLQQCFSYCALFPQDYKFKREELIHFWIGLEVLHSSHAENKRVEDIGQSHLTELVNYGFLEEKEGKHGRTCYIIHDLLYELAQKVSSLECLSIDSSQSQVNSLKVHPSICHLSINIGHTNVKDRLTVKNCVEDFTTLGTRLKVKKLRTLMIFGEHHGCFLKAFGDLFKEAKALRLVFLSRASYDVEDLLHNFYDLIHLRYLRIESSFEYQAKFPNKISRFYHMMVLDVQQCGNIIDLPQDMSNLIKLRHFLVANGGTHSSIVNIGKLKSLQELRRFMVKQKRQGFELREIGQLVDLRGSLSIYGLENVEVKEEVDEAKLLQKSHIHELILHWNGIRRSTSDSKLQELVLEKLRPSSNLQNLSIEGHWGTSCPLWLRSNLSIKSLESLCLKGVEWNKFPPIGEFWLVNVPREELSVNSLEQRFGNLRRLELCNLTMVQKWTVHSPCQLFPFLEVLIIKDCPQLVELSFQHIACCRQGKEVNANLFHRLSKLDITNCPQLLSFPPVPWSEAPCSINILGTRSSCLVKLVCEKAYNSEYGLEIKRKNDSNDNTIWNMLAFHNLTRLKVLIMWQCQPMPLRYIQMLSSLRELKMSCSNNAFPFTEVDSHVKYQFPVKSLVINEWNASGKELTQLLLCFPKLSDLDLTGLDVNVRGQHATETPGPSSPANKMEQQHGARAEEDVVVTPEEAERGILLLPHQLQELHISHCRKLTILRSNPHDDSNKDGRTREGDGLLGMISLQWLEICDCHELLSAYSSSSFSPSFPFPKSLEHLDIWGAVGTGAQMSLSNLTALTNLSISHCGELRAPMSLSNLTALTNLAIYHCGELRSEGLLSLLAQGHLTRLWVIGTPNFFVDSEDSQVHEHEIPSCSSKLQELKIDDVAGFTVAPIRHSLHFSSLTKLEIQDDNKVERFTEQQQALLFVNSLEDITFRNCTNVQSLHDRIHRLANLKRLRIIDCGEIKMLPKDCLPDSLQKLEIIGCGAIKILPKDCLPSSLQELKIYNCSKIRSLPCLPDSLQTLRIGNCPAIRSLPELDDLPSSLRKIDVYYSRSEELRSHCRKLINIIPIVIV